MNAERANGYFLGPLCINYGIVALGFVAPVLRDDRRSAGWIPFALVFGPCLGGALFCFP